MGGVRLGVWGVVLVVCVCVCVGVRGVVLCRCVFVCVTLFPFFTGAGEETDAGKDRALPD